MMAGGVTAWALQRSDAVASLSANGNAAFKESCTPIGQKCLRQRHVAVVRQEITYYVWERYKNVCRKSLKK